jgi:hypothetical protein
MRTRSEPQASEETGDLPRRARCDDGNTVHDVVVAQAAGREAADWCRARRADVHFSGPPDDVWIIHVVDVTGHSIRCEGASFVETWRRVRALWSEEPGRP